MRETTTKLTYLLGVPAGIVRKRCEADEEFQRLASLEGAALIRANCRARQAVLYHFTNGKKIFQLPDSLRSYCPGDLFEQFQEEYRRLYYAWDFVNAATRRIAALLPETLAELDIPHGDILSSLLFQWPEQNKVSLTALSEQYHSKRFRFPYDCFIPRPSSFESSLPYLLTSDAALFSAPPVDLAVSAQAASQRTALPRIHRRPPPPEWDMPRVRYLDDPFSPEDVETVGSMRISYVDFDNMPPFVTAQLCGDAAPDRLVKIFYDDRSRGSVEAFQGMEHVELHCVERLKSEKSLVDTRIIAEALRDCYERKPSQAVLFSSDSDFFVLASILSGQGVAFTVVGLEGNILPYYVEKLTEYADCSILSGKAAVPVLDRVMVRRLLARQLAARPLGESSVPELARLILDAFAEERYRGLLLKSVESEVERLLEGARLRVLNGQLQLEFPEDIISEVNIRK